MPGQHCSTSFGNPGSALRSETSGAWPEHIIEPQQPRALGIEEIGRQFRGRICFASLCDIQHTLPFKRAAEIQAEAKLLLERWAAPEGGFILIDYGDGAAIGVDLDKKEVMLEAFLQADPWQATVLSS